MTSPIYVPAKKDPAYQKRQNAYRVASNCAWVVFALCASHYMLT